MRDRLPLVAALVLVGTVALSLLPDEARAAQAFRVAVVPGLSMDDLERLRDHAAVGLLVPGAGSRVSEALARAALVTGTVRNSTRGGLPSGPPRITVATASAGPGSGPAIVLGLPIGGDQPNDRRYPIAVIGPGFRGLLTSSRTRIPGLVAIDDVAPTALEVSGGLSSRPSADPIGALLSLDQRIKANRRSRAISALVAGALVLALAFVFPRAALLGFAVTLGANLALGLAGVSRLWVVLLVIALAVGAGAPALARVVRRPLAVGLALSAVIVAYFVVLGVDVEAIALSPLGPSQNARYFGLSNILSAMLLLPVLAAIALLRTSLGWLPAALLAAASLVAAAGSRFGADGGGAIVLCCGFGVLAVELAGGHRRAVALLVALAALAVGTIVALDAVTGATSHLTAAAGSGPGGLAAELRDRAVLSYEQATRSWYVALLVVLGVVLLALLAARLASLLPDRARRAVPLSLAVAVGVSLFVNDSPLDVIAIGLVGFLTAQNYALAAEDRFAGNPYRRVET